MVDMTTVEQLLGVPPGYAPWRVADMAARARILATWLSSAVARDLELTPGAHAYLARMRRRMTTLHTLGEELATAHGLALIKGVRIARYLPDGLLRQSGDVDLVAPDEAALWRCALDLRDRYGAVPQGVSILTSLDGPRHVGVMLKWPAEEPHLDKPMGADITTCAFCGDLAGVPVRVTPPAEDDLCGLFAVAEERFQRRFRIKDRLDLLALAEALEDRLGDRLGEVVCAAADELALAPELRQLVRKTDEWVPVSARWQSVLAALEPLAAAEKARRRPGRPGVYRLRFGFPLDTTPGDELAVRIQAGPDGPVAATPLGTCLLVEDPVLTPDALLTTSAT